MLLLGAHAAAVRELLEHVQRGRVVARRHDGARQRLLSASRLARACLLRVREVPVVSRADAVRERRLRAASRAREILLTSSSLRGVPSGLLRSKTSSPRKPTMSAIERGELRDRDVLAAADVDDLGRVVALHEEAQRVGQVVDVEELAARRARAPDGDFGGAGRLSPCGTCAAARAGRAKSAGRSCRRDRRGSSASRRSR